jgi:NhaP-type Na+/H+ or K+/H+ antiporter
MFAALASAQHGSSEENNWLIFALIQILLGPLVGIAMGFIGARLLDNAALHKWMSSSFQGVGILALIILTYVLAEQVGGNGFIAAFVGGMVFGNTLKHACTFLYEFMESEGLLLILITFFLFGAILLPEGLEHFSITFFVYAALSLTIIRMLPVFISLLGTGVKLPTQLYLGWFGPRGLASILFVLLILEESEILHQSQILSITVITVALSALLHGVSAAPLSNRYGQYTENQGKCEESKAVVEMPLRDGYIKSNNLKSEPP